MDWRDVWRGLFPRRMIEPDLKEEISFHIEGRVRELLASGWGEEEARRHVLERFGNVASVEDECRTYDTQRVDGREWRMTMEAWIRDGRLALRAMGRNKGFTAVVVATLALGIGSTTAMFSIVEGVLLRPLPYPEPDRLVMVWENDRATGTTRENASPADYYDFVERSRSFQALGMWALSTVVLTRPDAEPVQLNVARVTRSVHGVFGSAMQLGRSFTEEEDLPDGPAVVILTDHVWRSMFHADPGALGRSVILDDVPREVVGVLPPGMADPAGQTDLWVPLQMTRALAPRPNHYVQVLGRMTPGATVASTQAEMSRIMAELELEYASDNSNRGAFVEALADVGRGDVRRTLWVLFGAVLAVLAIAGVNVANLLLARGASRTRELAVHTAIGAGRAQLIRRFFVEGVLLTAVASVVGIALAAAGIRMLTELAPASLSVLGRPEMNGAVLLFALAAGTVIGVGFAVLPVMQVRRLDLQLELKEGRTTEGGVPKMMARRVLVAVQLAMAVVLLVGATLLIETLRNIQGVDPGFRAAHLLRVDYTLPSTRYPRNFADWPNFVEVHSFHRQLTDLVESIPGVQRAAIAVNHPLDPGFTNSFVVEGRPYDANQGEMTTRLVSPAYFETAGLRLLEGRLPDRGDGVDDQHTIVLNRAAAERHFPDGDALGSRLRFWGPDYREVIGIVENERVHGLVRDVPPAMYVNLLQSPPVAAKITLLVKTEGLPMDFVDPVRRAIWAIDADLAVFNFATMEQTLADAAARERFASVILSIFSGVALFLAILGVHGVLAYLVAQRGREVGVRMALGATRRDVVALVVRQGVVFTAFGILAGLVGAYLLSRSLEGLLFGVSPTAWWAYAAVALALTVVALAATALPARRAASVDPVSSLRVS